MKPLTATMIKAGSRFLTLSVLGLISLLAQAGSLRFDIPAQPLPEALKVFAEQAKMQLLYKPDAVSNGTSNTVVGDFDKRAALELLLRGTGLEVVFSKGNAATVRPIEVAKATAAADVGMKDSALRLVQTDDQGMKKVEATPPPPPAPDSSAAESSSEDSKENEMTVTGTQLRGIAPVGSQLLVFTREDFDKAGAVTAEQFMATLLQNSAGDFSDRTLNIPGKLDVAYGNGVNLRGLGSASTLILVNGRRLATSGQDDYTNISMIPLSSVERIEVLTDGASAIYGSDAVGGVVNIILRSDYVGAESRLRTGISSEGDGKELMIAQNAGWGWTSGNVLLNYEHYSRDSISALDRSFSRAGGQRDLIPDQKKDSASISASQTLSPRIKISTDLLYAERDVSPLGVAGPPLEADYVFSNSKQASGSFGVDIKLVRSWILSMQGDAGRNIDRWHAATASGGSPRSFDTKSHHDSMSTSLTGDLFALRHGSVKAALGVGYRDEDFVTSSQSLSSYSARSAFVELMVPFMRNLKTTIAGRYEDYTTFGSTFDPKYGIEWSPIEDLRMRASYGTSFKVPTLYQLSQQASSFYQIGTGPGVRTLILRGNNPTLHQQTSSSLSVGFDFNPSDFPGLRVGLNYFDIDYDDKISAPVFGDSSTVIDRFRAAGLAVRRTDLPASQFDALIQQYLDFRARTWVGCTGLVDPITGGCRVPAATIDALVDSRLTNLARTRVKGMDATIGREFNWFESSVDLELNATYNMKLQQQLSSSTPATELLNTPYQPLKLRMRGTASWTKGHWLVGAFVNYSNSYDNTLSTPQEKIASWTTADLSLRTDLTGKKWLSGTRLMLNVQNVFDAKPPLLNDPLLALLSNVSYDPANADPVGRFFSLTIVKQW